MIKNLLKHDLKRMLKVLVYIYIIAICLSGVTRLINIGKDIQIIAIIGYVFSGLVYSAIGSILVNTFVQILRVFIVNFYKDESYLTHTLPVKKNKLLLSKYIASLIVILLSVVVCFISLFILFYSPEFIQGIKAFLEISVSGFNMSIGGFLIFMGFIIFSQICSMISMSFCAIVIANKYNTKKVIKGIAWFFAFYMITMFVTLMIAAIVFAISGKINELFATVLSSSSFILILIIALVLYIIYSIIFYLITNKQFNKGVNVE